MYYILPTTNHTTPSPSRGPSSSVIVIIMSTVCLHKHSISRAYITNLIMLQRQKLALSVVNPWNHWIFPRNKSAVHGNSVKYLVSGWNYYLLLYVRTLLDYSISCGISGTWLILQSPLNYTPPETRGGAFFNWSKVLNATLPLQTMTVLKCLSMYKFKISPP